MNCSRRSFVKLFPAIAGWRMPPLLSRTPRISPGTTSGPALDAAAAASPSPIRGVGPTYAKLGYKLFILDFQFSDLEPDTMKYADAEKIAEAVAEMGVESHLVYAITNTGFALYKSQFAPKFKNLPDDFLGDYLAACRKRGIKTVLYYSLCWQRILDVDHLRRLRF